MAQDPYDLDRFLRAQENDYERALAEIRSGRKQSHWMWYIFPQFEGLGFSPTSRFYSIKSVAEARAIFAIPCSGRVWWHAVRRSWPSRDVPRQRSLALLTTRN